MLEDRVALLEDRVAFLEGKLAAKIDLLTQVRDHLHDTGRHMSREVILIRRLAVCVILRGGKNANVTLRTISRHMSTRALKPCGSIYEMHSCSWIEHVEPYCN